MGETLQHMYVRHWTGSHDLFFVLCQAATCDCGPLFIELFATTACHSGPQKVSNTRADVCDMGYACYRLAWRENVESVETEGARNETQAGEKKAC